MTIEYRKAALEDAELLIDIYNASFYGDHLKYGACPGYGFQIVSAETDGNVELVRLVLER